MEKKEAMKILKDFYDKSALFSIRTALDTVIPELKESEESEDEKIRKALIKFHKSTIDVDGIKGKDIIAWLEKQDKHANFRNAIQIGDKVTRNEDGVLVNLSQLKRVAKPAEEYNITGISSKHAEGKLAEKIKERRLLNEVLKKQDEQKHICKLDNSYACVKFPFKAKVKSSGTIVMIHDGQLSPDGKEWIKYQSDKEDGYKIYEPNNLELVCEIEQKPAGKVEPKDYNSIDPHFGKPINKIEPKFKVGDTVKDPYGDLYHITEITDNSYKTDDGRFILFKNEDAYKLWTIQDAKDGDVLAENSCIFIIQKLCDNNTAAKTYCTLYDDGDFDNGTILYFDIDSTKPATKEKRDFLFRKMKEAGYMWDSEKKELRKIIVPIFNIGDTIIKKHNSNTHDFGSFTITDITGEKYWYNDRIICDILEQDEWEIYEPVRQKPAWSEEDEAKLKSILFHIEDVENKDVINWFKSLKDRYTWKPSDEQMEALEHFIVYHNGSTNYAKDLEELRLQLKKLMEE